MWIEAEKRADESEGRTNAVLAEEAPALLAVGGCSTLTAAQPAVSAGDNPGCMKSRGSFAALCGTSPVPASANDSGKPNRYRLSRGGDRQVSCALCRIAKTGMAHGDRAKAYVRKKTDEGKTKKEIVRCPKRYVANEAFRAPCNPKDILERRGSELRDTGKKLGPTQKEAAQMLTVPCRKIGDIELGKCRHLKTEEECCAAIRLLAAKAEENDGASAAQRSFLKKFFENRKLPLDGT